MTNQTNMFDGILPFTEIQYTPVSVCINVPYLNTACSGVPQEHITRLLGASLSSLFSRFTKVPVKTEKPTKGLFDNIVIDVDKLMEDADDYETMTIEMAVMGIVDYDAELQGMETSNPRYDDWRIERERFYEEVIAEIIKLLDTYLISNPLAPCGSQIDTFMNAIEEVGEIIVNTYSYYQETGVLWLTITC